MVAKRGMRIEERKKRVKGGRRRRRWTFALSGGGRSGMGLGTRDGHGLVESVGQ